MGTTDTIDAEAAITLIAAGDETAIFQASSSRTKKVPYSLLVPFTGKFRIFTQYITGSLTGLGTSTTNSSTVANYADIFVPYLNTWTGIAILNGATVGTDKGIVSLHDNLGNVLATSALAGATTSGASAFQSYNFTATFKNKYLGQYFIGYTSNGTTDNIQTIKTATILDSLTQTATGQVFGTVAALTPPTTFTADKGPIAFLF